MIIWCSKNEVENITTLTSYPIEKQTKIIIACMTLHNFIRDSALDDELFAQCDANEDFLPDVDEATTSQPYVNGEEESDMNALRDSIADGLMAMWQYVSLFVTERRVCYDNALFIIVLL
jgi:hypothetical protein